MNQSIQTLQFLGLDMINQANSGHPGIVLGAAPIMYELFQHHLVASPVHSHWFNRDRFVLSAGHGSALLYAILYLAGYQIGMEDLKKFRQLGSITPGHPEYGHTDGVEATTGPLGQGLAMAVGMAIAEKHLRHKYNKENLPIIDHFTYVLAGDGDLQEGVSLEAMSLAGHLALERLIVLFDSNDIQLDGPTNHAVSDHIEMKAKSMNWNYSFVKDGNDSSELSQAILHAKSSDRPTLIEVKTVIGSGSSKQGTSAVHGAPLGMEETLRMKKALGYPEEPFTVCQEVMADFREHFLKRSETKRVEWEKMVSTYQERYPVLAGELQNIIDNQFAVDYESIFPAVAIGEKAATRTTIGKALKALVEKVPAYMGGSADLSGSTKVKGVDGDFTKDNPIGRNINFGVREHAMGAVVNGLTLHHLRGFSGGFFVFSDYMKAPIRLAALMQIPSLFIFTHDSVAVGEDGPTHEPIEQLAMFRSLPGSVFIRPADANETMHALRYASEASTLPTIIALTRQDISVLHATTYQQFLQGAYVAKDIPDYEGILIASGSEVELALQTQAYLLEKYQRKVRVVSMPSQGLFINQSADIQESVLPAHCQKRLAIEMGASGMWYRFAKHVLGIDSFGVSAKGEDAIRHFGFTVENVTARYLAIQ